MKIKKVISLMLVIILCITYSSCQKKKKDDKAGSDKNLNIYIDIKDKNSLNIIKFLTEEYKNENQKVQLKINDVLGGNENVVEDVSKGTQADLIFTSRNTMMELSQKGLISDLGQYFEKNKIGEKYYNIIPAYGRIGEKYYGIAVMPYTMEIYYNIEALKKLGITQPTNIKDMVSVIKKLSTQNIRIPVVIPEDLDINTAVSAIAASNTLKLSELDNIYDNKNEYIKMKQMQVVFETINSAVKQLGVNKNSFEIGNESTFTSLISGSIPVALGTSYNYSNVKESKIINVVEDYTVLNNQKGVTPVIVNTLICMPSNGKNSEESGKFIKFILDEKTQEKLVKKGFISGNKKSNEKLSGMGKSIEKHLSQSNDNSIIYVHSLPKKFQGAISAKIDSILTGNYTGSEWEKAVEEVYK